VLAVVTPKFRAKTSGAAHEPEGSFSFALFDDDNDMMSDPTGD
jgi:hypothetical protein